MDLNTPLSSLLGPKTVTALSSGLDLRTAGDLLRHYPRRYAARGELTDLTDLREGEHVTVLAQVVVDAATHPMRRRKGSVTKVFVTDGRGRLSLTFFNIKPPLQRQLRAGRVGLFSGKVERFNKQLQLAHPDFQLLPWGTPADDDAAIEAAGDFARPLLAVYPATSQMSSWKIALAVKTVLDQVDGVGDPLPEEVRRARRLVDLPTAFRGIHRPEDRTELRAAQERLRFEEAFVLQAELARRRVVAGALPAVPRAGRPGRLLEAFDTRIPFELTAGQRTVGADVAADLAEEHPMHRLLQGEVGAGKTVVAIRAMLTVVDSGGQAVLLAPTEVLALQHYRSVTTLLGPLAEGGRLGGAEEGTRVALLTGSLRTEARRRALLEAASGEAGIVIGTHALLEDRVQFADLGLVVVDEQHRFGVEQRAALSAKGPQGARPHVLVMTATPIPRTVAMTVFGDLETSTLAELPAGRSEVVTHVVPAAERPELVQRAWARIREEVSAGHQAYIVCPRIGGDGIEDDPPAVADDPDTPAKRRPLAVLDVADQLAAGPLAGLRLAVLHGRLPPEEKDEVMRRFADGAVDVLISTTVIEVGVDVAGAAVMVVLDADRFGVSQLHQLRGRIGRGSVPGLCLLVTDIEPGAAGRARLDAVAATRDGFELSRVDLSQRRVGDVLGAAQSGRRSSLRLLSVLRDEAIIEAARAAATDVVIRDPALSSHPALSAAVDDLVQDEKADYLERG